MRRKLATRNSVCLQNQKRAKTSSDRNGYYLKWRNFCLEKIHNFPAAITFYHFQPKSSSRCHKRGYGEVKSHNQGDKTSTFMNVELEDHERICRPNLATFGGITLSASYSGYADDKSTQISRYSVRNTWHASKLWINTNLPQAVDFKSRLASVNEANSFRISQIPSQCSYSVSDVLAAGIVEVKTIRELVDCMFSWLIMRCFLLQGILPREVEKRMDHM
ncbi:uncharacterized protein [Nicotiana sylvestris]|uniref:Uncharacterized protein isoform X1 n=3 Tax=Nicotiana TaxID=4085 RepID=A0A1S4CPF3_TOBAC|nr:PREDICTED: uncharacterized protein LOC104242200 isoform X2 [Nicotiana sylvestris]XP_016503137.1 PREDICTED: uncharacterized protein LOC107821229 isoform X1 [Nicotiana tabacum]